MKYVGMYTQVSRNNKLTIMLLLSFPALTLLMVWLFYVLLSLCGVALDGNAEQVGGNVNWTWVNGAFIDSLPWVVGTVSVENLTMTAGMDMPKINVVDDPQLNAFASGIDRKSYTVTVTTGLLKVLNDDELAGVIAHELTHIRNRDTRLLITSIIFVGIITTIIQVSIRSLFWIVSDSSSSSSSDDDDNNNGGAAILVFLIAIFLGIIAYFFALLTRFAISRKREYMADAGGAELCGNPLALASALRKISDRPGLKKVKRDDVAQLFIVHPQALSGGKGMGFFTSLFSTHPDTQKRIEILEQF